MEKELDELIAKYEEGNMTLITLKSELLWLFSVVGRSEQLKAFADWLQSDTANLNYDFKDLVDEYLKSL
jgi:hypothetical protein